MVTECYRLHVVLKVWMIKTYKMVELQKIMNLVLTEFWAKVQPQIIEKYSKQDCMLQSELIILDDIEMVEL